MAYTATLTPYGTYQISQDGNVISTTSASGLVNFGLSTTQLSTPTTQTATTPQPTAIGNQVAATQQAQNAAQPVVQQPQAVVKPSIPSSMYSTVTQMVQSGQMTAQQARQQVQGWINSGQYSDTSVNLSELFPKGLQCQKARPIPMLKVRLLLTIPRVRHR